MFWVGLEDKVRKEAQFCGTVGMMGIQGWTGSCFLRVFIEHVLCIRYQGYHADICLIFHYKF